MQLRYKMTPAIHKNIVSTMHEAQEKNIYVKCTIVKRKKIIIIEGIII